MAVQYTRLNECHRDHLFRLNPIISLASYTSAIRPTKEIRHQHRICQWMLWTNCNQRLRSPQRIEARLSAASLPPRNLILNVIEQGNDIAETIV